MSGLVKQKQFDWKDSNLALFGSATEKQVKKDAAATEPAWKGAGKHVGLQIWRIVKFKVTDWPKEDYGKFFSGDSYIILNTYRPDPKSEELAWDAHFWIGSQSSQDEYATAAYKTVELDMTLDDAAVQHREVMGQESDRFHGYFKEITIMEGGAESGFRHVKAEKYQPRLLHFCGVKRNITVKEVPLSKSSLNSGDVFIMDLGTKLYQWNGSGSNKDEKFKAVEYMNKVKSERGKVVTSTLEQETALLNHEFYESLTEPEVSHVEHAPMAQPAEHQLFKVSDEGGKLTFGKVKEGKVTLKDLDTKDVFILDVGNQCFVWVGHGASSEEKRNGFTYAHSHLMTTNHQLVPVVVVKEGQQNTEFNTAVAA